MVGEARRQDRWWLLPLSILMILPLILCSMAFLQEQHFWIMTLGLTMVYLTFGIWLMLCLYRNSDKTGPLGSLLAKVGFYSYSIYLWHMPVKDWGLKALEHYLKHPLPFGWVLLIYLGGSLFLGIAMGKLIEWPFLRLRDRYFPSRSLSAAK